jgi:hypothetical protein
VLTSRKPDDVSFEEVKVLVVEWGIIWKDC